jgi:hypothetical protein
MSKNLADDLPEDVPGRAIIALDEHLLLQLLDLPKGTRVLSTHDYAPGACVIVQIESEALPRMNVKEWQGRDLPRLWNVIFEVDDAGNKRVRWPELEPKPDTPAVDYMKREEW